MIQSGVQCNVGIVEETEQNIKYRSSFNNQLKCGKGNFEWHIQKFFKGVGGSKFPCGLTTYFSVLLLLLSFLIRKHLYRQFYFSLNFSCLQTHVLKWNNSIIKLKKNINIFHTSSNSWKRKISMQYGGGEGGFVEMNDGSE